VTRVARGYLVVGAQILIVAAGYYAAGRFGLSIALVRNQITPLWPPTGISLAALMFLGARCWPGISIGALLVNLPIGPNVWVVLAITAGNTLAPLAAYRLLRRIGFRTQLDRLRDALSLVFLGAIGGMLISAIIGAGVLWLSGALPRNGFWAAWSVWWAGDAMGVLVVAPVLLVIGHSGWPWRAPLARWAEGIGLPLGIFGFMFLADKTSTPVFFLAFPLLVWAALRFQQLGAAPCALVMSVIAAVGAARGHGPFGGLDLVPTMLTLQAFNASTALTALLLAAVTSERNEAQRAVERAVSQLADAVASLEPYRLLRDGLLDNVLRERVSPGSLFRTSPAPLPSGRQPAGTGSRGDVLNELPSRQEPIG
jgi:integral membrane sensor domain MASE1